MAAITYPGVYLEELPNGQHNITGVATSIAAFIGWANQGPAGKAVMIESWPQYVATFGGFYSGVYLGYAVYQFFQNGGSQAYVIRLVDGASTAGSTIGLLDVVANSPGGWGNSISIAIESITASTFNLQVTGLNSIGATVTLESYTNLSIFQADAQYAVTVINNDSNYVKLTSTPSGIPAAIPMPATAAATALNAGGTPTTGADGNILTPTSSNAGSGTFEILLGGPTGFALLSGVPIFNLLCVPGETAQGSISAMQTFCFNSRAFLIVDSPHTAIVSATTINDMQASQAATDGGGTPLTGTNAANSAFYFPWVQAPDPAVGNRLTYFPPSGFVAGIYAATDSNIGVWKAPAGINAQLGTATGLQFNTSDLQNEQLNPYGINCLRQFTVDGPVVWGSRTIAGTDTGGSQWQYVPIRRLAMFIESSLYQGTQWVVFEPNAEPLWEQVRLSIGSFMQSLFLKGAFAGSSTQQAYFVKCDGANNPALSVSQGILNMTVGFAPLNPAEFVIIQIQQMINPS